MKLCLTAGSAVVLLTVLLAFFEHPSLAQSDIQYLEDDKVTKESLIESLRPRRKAPRTRSMDFRGLEVLPNSADLATPEKAECESIRKYIARENTRSPVSHVVAIKIGFAFDSAEISHASERKLDTLAEALKSSDLQNYCFEVQGHTDSLGADEYNLTLSERRANSVIRYLSTHHSVEKKRLVGTGRGESDPFADNDSETGRQQNRRVQILNLGSGAAN